MNRTAAVNLLCCFCLLALSAAILVPNYIRPRSRGVLTACKSNLKNIGTALEMYSTDWNGLYPASLGQLTPNYLKTIPECPGRGAETYSKSYKVKTFPIRTWSCPSHTWKVRKDFPLCDEELSRLNRHMQRGSIDEIEQRPSFVCPHSGQHYSYWAHCEACEFFCEGENHANVSVPRNYPKYNGVQGLVEFW